MSYYYKHNLQFSVHALMRIKERLNLKSSEEFAIKQEIIDIIEKSPSFFENSKNFYIQCDKTDKYFIIDKNSNTIITVTSISFSKMLELLDD